MATVFGHPTRAEFPLEPHSIYLNHGTVGVPSRRVLAAQQAIRDRIEQHPSRFLLRQLREMVGRPPEPGLLLRQAAGAVARYVGGEPGDLVFVDNATTGANAVLRSLPLRPGEEVAITDHAYGAVRNAALFATRERGAVLRSISLPPPALERRALATDALVGAVTAALSERTRLLIVDHVTSESALVLPVAAIAAASRARGVPVLVDGAHAPGMIPLDVASLGVDWYTANLHKWAWAPRSSGFLWAAPARQRDLHPTVISWGLDQGFTDEFDWVGTRDPSAHLAFPYAVDQRRALGEERIVAYNHTLALAAARLLAERLGVPFETPEEMIGSMATLPLPERLGSERHHAAALRDHLLFERGIEVQIHAGRGRLWVRLCAQVYNQIEDYELLADGIEERLDVTPADDGSPGRETG